MSKKLLSNVRTSRSKIERVFRDKDELPITNNLEDPIIKALSESEYLIVICTPRLKESIWCKKEIETFIQMHGRD
ncbi:MAG: toll/interleukin-1 receptor domain-containing protein, partial [Lachnospiraceae bacterium]|nr:toll/interleukin-1 receptor domain-containing protein [Lachnospiraceae bacterium]